MQLFALFSILIAAVLAIPFNFHRHHARNETRPTIDNSTHPFPLPPAADNSTRPFPVTPIGNGTSPESCHPGAYRCSADHKGWEVCSVLGQFQSAGDCSGGVCVPNGKNNIPYCV